MRIIGGKFRGHCLAPFVGKVIRPTGERVREALFDILAHNRFSGDNKPLPEGIHVADIFAGTGALGLEALSRGAKHVTFIETNPAACQLILKNVASLGMEDRVQVLRRNALRPGRTLSACKLILLDPPYRTSLVAPALLALVRSRWLAEGAITVIKSEKPVATIMDFTILKDRRYGSTCLTFLRWHSPSAKAPEW